MPQKNRRPSTSLHAVASASKEPQPSTSFAADNTDSFNQDPSTHFSDLEYMSDDDFEDDTTNFNIPSRQSDIDELQGEIREYVGDGVSSSTAKKIKASVNKFEKFIKARGQDKELLDLDVEYIDALLAVFLKGLKRDNGQDYEPVSVQNFSCCIRKFLASKIPGVEPDKSFPVSKSALARKKKELKSLGKGNRPNRAQCLTDQEEELLWERGALGDSTPDVLRNTMWFLCTKLLGFRGKHESEQLLWSDLKIETSELGEYIEFNERLSKTRDGVNGIARDFQPKMFPNTVQPERCPLRLYRLYLSHRPKTQQAQKFFIHTNKHPRATTWYIDSNMGVNEVAKTMKNIATDGGLSGRFTNHSVRRTMCSQLLNSGKFSAVTVAQLTGHKDPNSLKQYMTASENTQRAMCEVLQNPQRHQMIQQPCYPPLPNMAPETRHVACGPSQNHALGAPPSQQSNPTLDPVVGPRDPQMAPQEDLTVHHGNLEIEPSQPRNSQTASNDDAIQAFPPNIPKRNNEISMSSKNQVISSSQAVLRGAFAGASFHAPVTINLHLNSREK